MSKTSIIQRRDLEPLWYKANTIVRHYEKAAGCIAAVIGADCVSVNHSSHPLALFFCSLCKQYRGGTDASSNEHLCEAMHLEAVHKARSSGGYYVYTCSAGFYFWTSSFFFGERFAGALISSGVLAVERQIMEDRFFSICQGNISRDEIVRHIAGLPEKSATEIQSLARMLLLCSEQISCRGRRNRFEDDSQPQGITHHSQLMDKERLLLACLRRGDCSEAQRVITELLNDIGKLSGDNFDQFRLKAIELVVMLSRAGSASENGDDPSCVNSRFFRWIENAQTEKEVAEKMRLVVDWLASSIFSFQGIRHASALRKAERFIWENYTRKITLKEVAGVSGLSAPYFSTIFKDEMGENLSNYLNRLRVEKASTMLRETEYSINGISSACGFEDQSWFSKIFKNYTGASPYRYRELGGLEEEKQGRLLG